MLSRLRYLPLLAIISTLVHSASPSLASAPADAPGKSHYSPINRGTAEAKCTKPAPNPGAILLQQLRLTNKFKDTRRRIEGKDSEKKREALDKRWRVALDALLNTYIATKNLPPDPTTDFTDIIHSMPYAFVEIMRETCNYHQPSEVDVFRLQRFVEEASKKVGGARQTELFNSALEVSQEIFTEKRLNAEAEDTFTNCADILAKSGKPNETNLALSFLAQTKEQNGKLAEALKIRERLVDDRIRIDGATSASAATALVKLAITEAKMNNQTTCSLNWKRALAIITKLKNSDDFYSPSEDLARLAVICAQEGMVSESIQIYKRMSTLSDHLDRIMDVLDSCANNLQTSYLNTGHYTDLEDFLQFKVDKYKEYYGSTERTKYAHALLELAEAYKTHIGTDPDLSRDKRLALGESCKKAYSSALAIYKTAGKDNEEALAVTKAGIAELQILLEPHSPTKT